MTMTIKSFKEQSQVKEIGPAIGLAVRAAPYAVPAAIALGRAVSAYSKARSPSSGKKSASKTTTAYSSKAPSAKGKAENYVSNAQRKAVWANKADGGKGHPDKKKKESVDEISRYDLGKKIISTMGTKAPTMLTKHDAEKKKVKTDLARLRKALGPNHVMNQSAASEGLFFGKKGPAIVSRLARGVASRVTTKGKLDRAKKKQGKLDNKINLMKTRDSNKAKKTELRKMRTDRIKRAVGIGA